MRQRFKIALMVELFARLIFRLRRLMLTETDLNVRRAVSPLLATLILIAIVVSAGLVVYGIVSGWMGIFGANLKVQAVSVDLVKAGDKALLSVSIKNVGNKPLAGIVVTGHDDNGKPFKIALPPAEPGQVSGNTLVIPLGVSNIVLDASGNNNHGTLYGSWSWVSDKNFGTCLSLSGGGWAEAYVDVPEYNFTIEVWIKTSQANQGVFDIDWNGHDRHFGVVSSGLIYHRVWTGSGWTGTKAVNDGKWHAWALTVKTGEGQKAYVDAFFAGSFSYDHSDFNWQKTAEIGLSRDFSNRFSGLIAGVKYYSKPLSEAELQFNIRNPNFPLTEALVFWYPLAEGNNASYSLTVGNSYALTVTAYSLDGGFFTVTTAAECR